MRYVQNPLRKVVENAKTQFCFLKPFSSSCPSKLTHFQNLFKPFWSSKSWIQVSDFCYGELWNLHLQKRHSFSPCSWKFAGISVRGGVPKTGQVSRGQWYGCTPFRYVWAPRYLLSRWWFQIFFYFHPYLGKIPILTNIFQMGWNHQLVVFSRGPFLGIIKGSLDEKLPSYEVLKMLRE